MKTKMIATCGMNCNICIGHMREKKTCPGCREQVEEIYCRKCIIRNCEYFKKSNNKYCFSCPKYPCTRLKNLDK